MQFLPIVQRELLVASRKRGTYLARSLSAGILLAFFPAALSMQRGLAGARLLQVLSIILFLECLLAGVRYTSDCLSEEKREGTLGLLFLTNLSGFDVVVGKMVALSLGGIFNLVAAIPILAISVMVGGVTGEQIISLSVALLVITIFSLCVGAFVSSRGYGERAVLVQTLLWLIVASLGPLLIVEAATPVFNFFAQFLRFLNAVWALTALGVLLDCANLFRNVSPLHLFNQAGRGFGPSVQPALWTLLGLSAVMLVYSAWRIRACFGQPEKVEQTSKQPALARRRRFSIRKYSDPVLWLALTGRTRKFPVFFFCVFAIALGAFTRIAIENHWGWGRPLAVFGTYGIHLLYKFLITAETCRQLSEDKRSGALELLLTTPIQGSQVVRSHIVATRKTWLPAAVGIAIMNWIWMTEESFISELGILLPCSILLLVSDCYALAWRAILNSLKGERYVLTVCKTYFRVIAPPMAAIMITIAFCMGASAGSEAMKVIFVLWTLASVFYDLTLAFDARQRLADLRAVAAGDGGGNRQNASFRAFPRRMMPRPGMAHPA
jgi:ABC-type Na+ efflux pump permease subunit